MLKTNSSDELRFLEVDEKRTYDDLMKEIDIDILNCWNHKAPCTFTKTPDGFDKS